MRAPPRPNLPHTYQHRYRHRNSTPAHAHAPNTRSRPRARARSCTHPHIHTSAQVRQARGLCHKLRDLVGPPVKEIPLGPRPAGPASRCAPALPTPPAGRRAPGALAPCREGTRPPTPRGARYYTDSRSFLEVSGTFSRELSSIHPLAHPNPPTPPPPPRPPPARLCLAPRAAGCCGRPRAARAVDI